MKNVRSLYSQELDILKKNDKSLQKSVAQIIPLLKRSLFVAFVVFAFNATATAQTSVKAVNTSMKQNTDISYLMGKDKATVRKDRQKLEAVREEKQQLKELNAIPQTTMDKFAAQFPKAEDVEWSVPGGFIEAYYTYKNADRVAFYDWENDLIGHGRYVDYSTLPQNALKYISKHYSGYTPVRTMWYDNNEDNDFDIELWGITFDQDSYITLLKNGAKEIALQISRDGDVTFFDQVQ